MENHHQEHQIILNETAIENLRIARKWSNFIAIIGFIIIGLMILGIVGVIIAGSLFPHNEYVRFTAFVQVVPIALMAVIYGVPIYYLYQFGKHSKHALADYNSDTMNVAFHYLKLHYRFLAMLIVMVLVFYIVATIVILMAFPFISTMMHQ